MWNPPPHRLLDSLHSLYEKSRNALFGLIFPPACSGCRISLRYPDVLCETCAAALKRIIPPFCGHCGNPLPQHWHVKICPDCHLVKSALTKTRSGFYYEGLVRQMIRSAKYQGRARVLHFFAQHLFPLLGSDFPRKVSALVPVPLHSRREWDRRFNQAELLAQHLQHFSGIPVWQGLVKVKKTPPQSKLTGLARRRNLKGSFVCKKTDFVPGSIFLIDDVVTTGATLEECARVLRRAGVRRVYGLTIARAVMRK